MAERDELGRYTSEKTLTKEQAREMQKLSQKSRMERRSMQAKLFQDAGYKKDGSDASAFFQNIVEKLAKDGTKWASDAYKEHVGITDKPPAPGETCSLCGRGKDTGGVSLFDELLEMDALPPAGVDIVEEMLGLLDTLDELIYGNERKAEETYYTRYRDKDNEPEPETEPKTEPEPEKKLPKLDRMIRGDG
jgi:hypothetical protein